MRDYKVTVNGTQTIVEVPEYNFRMQVYKSDDYVLKGETALLEATLYVEQRSYIPYCSYFFEAINANGEAILECSNIDLFKSTVDFYFNSVLNTDLYVKSVPRSSILYPKDLKEFNYNQ